MKKDVSITVGFRTLMPKPHEDMYYLIDLIMHHPDAEIGETWNATDENLEWLTEDVQSLADGIVDEIVYVVDNESKSILYVIDDMKDAVMSEMLEPDEINVLHNLG